MYKIPEFLLSMLQEQYGEEITKVILEGYMKKRLVTFRVNTLKSTIEEVKEELLKSNIEFDNVPWNNEAFIMKQASASNEDILNAQENLELNPTQNSNLYIEHEIRKMSIYIEGKIYLQSLSSMLPAIILDPQEGENILDMAAAPGGKTTQIAALTNNKSYITACEMNLVRAERLKYNIQKQGVANTYVMITDSRKLDDMFSFDRILLDAPCSGSGTIYNEDVNLGKTFTMKLINKSKSTQYALLKKAIKLLKPGKEMIYSTCSILSCENEDNISKILKEEKVEIVPINIEKFKQIPILPTKIEGTLCVCPNELYEGFYIAKIKKKV